MEEFKKGVDAVVEEVKDEVPMKLTGTPIHNSSSSTESPWEMLGLNQSIQTELVQVSRLQTLLNSLVKTCYDQNKVIDVS